MKRVWKCGYCPDTGTMAQMRKHEEACYFNPIFKSCQSCEFHNLSDVGMVCEVIPYESYLEIRNEKNACHQWTPEKQDEEETN